MSNIAVELPSDATFEALECRLWATLGREAATLPSCFTFVDVLGDRIYKTFLKTSRVSDIRMSDKIYAIEVQLMPDVPVPAHTFVPVVFRKQVKPTYQTHEKYAYERCAPPRAIGIPEGATNAQVLARLRLMAEAMLKHSSVPEPWEFAVVRDVDTYAQKFGEDFPDDENRFAVTEQVGVNFLNPDKARQMKDALPAVAKGSAGTPGGTTLLQCLEKNAEREQLSEADTAYCRKCKDHRQQFKKLELWSLPPVLIVHLKRFGRDTIDGPLKKIGCKVDLPRVLDLGPYLRRPAMAQFELFGVVNHHGNVGGGHYTANAMVTTTSDQGVGDGEWFNFNDATVKRASVDDVDEEAAYILFYRRRPT